MEQVLIAFDESSYQSQVANFEAAAELIQEVVEQYKTLNLPALTSADLYQLFQEPIDLIFDKMTDGQPVSIGNYQINKSKAIEILEKPQGYEALLSKVAQVCKSLADESFPPMNIVINAQTLSKYFELSGSGVVTLKETTKAAIENGNKKFATTDAAKKVLAFAQAVATAYKEHDIKNAGRLSGNGLAGLIQEVIDYKDTTYTTREVSLNIDGIARYNQNTTYKAPK